MIGLISLQGVQEVFTAYDHIKEASQLIVVERGVHNQPWIRLCLRPKNKTITCRSGETGRHAFSTRRVSTLVYLYNTSPLVEKK